MPRAWCQEVFDMRRLVVEKSSGDGQSAVIRGTSPVGRRKVMQTLVGMPWSGLVGAKGSLRLPLRLRMMDRARTAVEGQVEGETHGDASDSMGNAGEAEGSEAEGGHDTSPRHRIHEDPAGPQLCIIAESRGRESEECRHGEKRKERKKGGCASPAAPMPSSKQ